MKPKIRVIPLGGAAEIGANSYYISWEKNDGRIFSLLLDAGMRGDGPSVENLPDFSKLDTKVDAVIISHAHNDHIGSLPFVLKNFLKDDGKIYMTSKTSIIAAKTLKDSAKIVSGKGKFSSVIKKLYSNQNMDDIIDRTIKVDYNNEIKLNDDIRMVFYDAGHVYGSSSILLKDENFSLFYTGDFNCAETFIHNGVRIPDNLTADIMITEATNYSKSESNLKNQEKIEKLGKIVSKTIKGGGRVLLPAFSLGRTQEVLRALDECRKKGLIPDDVEFYISEGLTRTITNVYENEKIYIPHYNVLKNGHMTPPKSVYIASSGFFTKESPAGVFAENIKNDENSTIVFTSSYAYETVDGGNKWFKDNKCEIRVIDFSAHSDREGIKQLCKRIKPKYLLPVHGDLKSINDIENSGLADSVIAFRSAGEEVIFYKDYNEVKSVIPSRDDSYIVTVGASLYNYNNKHTEITENIKDDNDAKKRSAELNTILSIDNNFNGKLFNLVATDTYESSRSAELISKYLEDNGAIVVLHKIKFSLKPDDINNSIEMSDLISCLSRLMYRNNNASMIFSGGFKFEVAISYLLSNLYHIDVYYKHEGMDISDSSLILKSIPIKFDYEKYALYLPAIEAILMGEPETSKREFEELPFSLKSLFYKNNDSYFLNNMGSLIYFSLKNKRNELDFSELGYMLADKDYLKKIKIDRSSGCIILKDNFRNYKDNIFEMFVSKRFAKLILNIASRSYVRTIRFGRVEENRFPLNDLISLELNEAKNQRLIYTIYYGEKKQKIVINVFPAWVKEVLNIFEIKEGEIVHFNVDK